MAPALMAWTDIGMSAAPVRKTIGSERSDCASVRCSASPSSPGMLTSSTRQPRADAECWARNVLCRFEERPS